MAFVRLLSISFVEAQPELGHQVLVVENYLFTLWVTVFTLDYRTFQFFASPLISQFNLVCVDHNLLLLRLLNSLLVVRNRSILHLVKNLP